jgi:MFS family permease
MTEADTDSAVSTWAPLRTRMFRIIWLAQLGSNIGTWMQMVGAQWLLVDEPRASTLVSLVQTASTLPFLVFGLASGVLADVFDRRRYLIGLQTAMVVIAASMSALTVAGRMPPALLLTLTFLLASGSALAMPAWQALTPVLVSRAELPQATALAGMNQNLARVVGPALAGGLVAALGVGAVFAINALSFVGGIIAMILWRRPDEPAVLHLERERMGAAMAAGTRYVRNAPTVRRLLLRLVLFVVPATALWALLPVVASQRLGLDSSGYGLLLAALGAGAVLGALLMTTMRRHLAQGWLLGGSGVLYAVSLAVTGVSRNEWVVLVALLPGGLAWLSTVVTISASLQQVLPGWVRARGLAFYQLAFMGGQAVAALLWGALAQRAGLPTALLSAAFLLMLASATLPRWPLPDITGLDRSTQQLPLPELAFAPEPTAGPVLVTVTYAVRHENVPAFVAAMSAVERTRRRTGAIRWELYVEGEDPGRLVETYEVRTWAEHLQQHHRRFTGHDRLVMKRATDLAETAPLIAHLFPADGTAGALPVDPGDSSD